MKQLFEKIETGLYRSKLDPKLRITALVNGPFAGLFCLSYGSEEDAEFRIVCRGNKEQCEASAWDEYHEALCLGAH